MSLICLRTLAQLEVKCCLDILNEVSRGSIQCNLVRQSVSVGTFLRELPSLNNIRVTAIFITETNLQKYIMQVKK
jgi:hypothetical protein